LHRQADAEGGADLGAAVREAVIVLTVHRSDYVALLVEDGQCFGRYHIYCEERVCSWHGGLCALRIEVKRQRLLAPVQSAVATE
jgi:hypothetical protein